MPREFSRTQRVADALRKELASVIQLELRDPRLTMVSVTDVEVSRDLAHARVFYTAINAETEEQAAESTKVLNRAAGFLRSRVAKQLRLRVTPELTFAFDSSVGRGRHLSALIDEAAAADREMGLLAEGSGEREDG